MGKNGGAAKHYPLMRDRDLRALPVADIAEDRSALFMWVTCPRLDFGIDLLRDWGFHYRGVAFVWVKTTNDGVPMGAAGPPPSFVKPTTELVIVGTRNKSGRPWPLGVFNERQVILAPRSVHSRKPAAFREAIERLAPNTTKIELFARQRHPGWDAWGNEV